MINEAADKHEMKPRPLGRDAQERIGAGLQAAYAEVEGEPLPDEQIDLLLALRRKERELERDRSCGQGPKAEAFAGASTVSAAGPGDIASQGHRRRRAQR